MERQALVLYLQNVRDLEVAKAKVHNIYTMEEHRFNNYLQELPTEISVETRYYDEKPELRGNFAFLILGAVLFILGAILSLETPEIETLSLIGIFFGLALMLPFIGKFIVYLQELAKKMKNEVDAFNEQSFAERKRQVAQNKQLRQEKTIEWE